MTVVRIDPEKLQRPATVLTSRGDALRERSELMVSNTLVGSSFGARDTEAADAYRAVGEALNAAAGRISERMRDNGDMLAEVANDFTGTDSDTAAALRHAAADWDGAL